MLALGDALAVALSERRGFKEEDFANLHPGGKLGKRFARVSSLMHSGDAVPRVAPATPMGEVIYEMSRKGLGMTTVVEGEKLVGLISDGDLRRLLEHHGKEVLELTAGRVHDALTQSRRPGRVRHRRPRHHGAKEDHCPCPWSMTSGRAARRAAPA